MSATMIARDLAAGHGDRVLFSGLALVVGPGDVIGLVGVNGAGKTTLLRTLAGLVPLESGSVSFSPPTATVGYLPQERERRAGVLVDVALPESRSWRVKAAPHSPARRSGRRVCLHGASHRNSR